MYRIIQSSGKDKARPFILGNAAAEGHHCGIIIGNGTCSGVGCTNTAVDWIGKGDDNRFIVFHHQITIDRNRYGLGQRSPGRKIDGPGG